MSRLGPSALHIRFVGGATSKGPPAPRRYTFAHSGAAGEPLLTIGPTFDRKRISGWYTCLMRDKVL